MALAPEVLQASLHRWVQVTCPECARRACDVQVPGGVGVTVRLKCPRCRQMILREVSGTP